ncbi:MAG: aminomethyl-transferring glycine dehydrogenase subunit GcvPB [Oscillospiraceae bacterium]
MKTIFELGAQGRHCDIMPCCDVAEYKIAETFVREKKLNLPKVSEIDISRHYTALSKRVHGVNCGFYPLGSCTMKYNPRVDEEAAGLPGFERVHPLQRRDTVQGSLEVLSLAGEYLSEITGMDAMTFQPAAGAHGELTGVLLIKAYHTFCKNTARTKIIVPDAAHGTNPATAAMAGYEVVNVPSNSEGGVDLELLKKAVGEDTAGLMLTNPNTLGIFDKNILEITKTVHDAGGLCYYDGANLNAVMGIARPGDMGFDCVHLNLHKTFATPHGGGGPGSGAVGCKEFLAKFMPKYMTGEKDGKFELFNPENSIGSVKEFYGNFLVVVKALTYILTLGSEGIPEAAKNAVLNANYLRTLLHEKFDVAYDGICMHEFVLTLERLKKETGVSAMDMAKAMLDNGIHPPTMYFPLIVHEALMLEPTETESKQTLDEAAQILLKLYDDAYVDSDILKSAPHTMPIGRPDEVMAARSPKLRYVFD